MSASVAGLETDNDDDGEQQQQPRETLLQEKERVSLDTLPDEIILTVCEFLDVPELGALGKTTHRLRALSTDPLLHKIRLHRAKATLAASLQHRPSLPLLRDAQIYLTRRQHTQRVLSRALLGIRLKHHFLTRPSLPALQERGVMYRCGGIAPALAGRAKDLERERVKDRLRRWVVERLSLEEAVGCGLVLNKVVWEEGRREGVRSIARRLMARWGNDGQGEGKRKVGGSGVACWGRGRVVRYDPPRAMVLGLKRHFEKLAAEGGIHPRVTPLYLIGSRN
ncbi:unnamed protein product [Tuber melanosporum]|uniref:(Perigord truffle) hypothetical protein n=1 Tax=Tuber melanosporum (strain Mel28) TaxID=656061 RepID=D5GFM3_TUBMM|nr:uncharacterized protein GSTUM_00006984001 [Tuber melanosporum]CAZ83316.1 unnamed protein product [Tuber melanosporum]